jgi:hypothetical protein
MPNVTITVKAISRPKGRGPGGALDSSTESWFNYWPDKVTVEKGVTYDVEYLDDIFNGRQQKIIQKATAKAAAPLATAPRINGHAPNGDDRGGVPPHVSNWVAHAIQAGLIKTPAQLCSWAQWSYQAGVGMTNRPATMPAERPAPPRNDQVAQDIDDEIPY